LISGCMFGLGAFLAGFGGVMGGPIFGVYPVWILNSSRWGFVVVIVGGRGASWDRRWEASSWGWWTTSARP